MAKIHCFSALFSGNKKSKKSSKAAKRVNGTGALRVNPEELVDQSMENAAKEVSFKQPVLTKTQGKSSAKNANWVGGDKKDDYSVRTEAAAEAAYEGGDEHDDNLSMKRDFSDSDLRAFAAEKGETSSKGSYPELSNDGLENKSEKVEGITPEVSVHNGHVTDPGLRRTAMLWGSPMLNRSCSNIETKRASKLIRSPIKSNSSDDVHNIWGTLGDYCSDTLQPSAHLDMKNKPVMEKLEIKNKAELLPQKQWIALDAGSSSLDRVNAWVRSLEDSPICPVGGDENGDDETAEEAFSHPVFFEVGETSGKKQNLVLVDNVIQSLCSFPPVAHIAGMGLKVIPAISAFSSLRSVNLSGNSIVNISSGLLPKNVHTLDLSRNKIVTIEGLRELTRLRVLNLSHNKISRISYGLSNCIVIKELYLAGNRISDVEGLHRLLKLTLLDLSFNKIATAKALGQLVANYKTLLALNLLGNPIQSNVGEEQLRKVICGFLPQLAFLNKQHINKPQRGIREVVTHDIAKAALGSDGWRSSRRRMTRRVSQSSASSAKSSRAREGSSHRGSIGSSRQRTKSKHQHSISSRK